MFTECIWSCAAAAVKFDIEALVKVVHERRFRGDVTTKVGRMF